MLKFLLRKLNPFYKIDRTIKKLHNLGHNRESATISAIVKPKNNYPTKLKALNSQEVLENLETLPLANVKHIIDGDTVILTKETASIKVRLDSIDCPEDGQPWGDRAKFGLIKMIGGKPVHIEEHGFDIHGRTLATLYTWNTKKSKWMNVNEHMVTCGHAWVMRLFYDHLPADRQNRLNSLERWAKSKRIGLWSDSSAIAPWNWRKNC